MIHSIQIAGTEPYLGSPQSLSELPKINFFFGANGTGKTTISRILADASRYPSCTITWKGGSAIEPMVYNSDFVRSNFDQSGELKGVFTLGEEDIDAKEKVKKAKFEIDRLNTQVEQLTTSLQGPEGTSGKLQELRELEVEFKEACWAQKVKHDSKEDRNFNGDFENSPIRDILSNCRIVPIRG